MTEPGEDGVDLEQWAASLPETFDDEYLGNLSVGECERIEENPGLVGPVREEAYRAYVKARFGNVAKAFQFGASPGMTQLGSNIAKLARMQSPVSHKIENLARASRVEIPRPDYDGLAESMAEVARERRREQDEQRQREIDTLGALRGIQAALAEQNSRARHSGWVQHATLALALLGVVAAIGALVWSLSEDRSTTAWISAIMLVAGAVVIVSTPRIRRRWFDRGD